MLDAALAALTSERLVLRRFRPEDLDTFVAYRSDPGTARFKNREAPYRPSQARRFLQELAAIHPDTPGQDRLHPCPRAPGIRLCHRDCSETTVSTRSGSRSEPSSLVFSPPRGHAAERPFRGR